MGSSSLSSIRMPISDTIFKASIVGIRLGFFLYIYTQGIIITQSVYPRLKFSCFFLRCFELMVVIFLEEFNSKRTRLFYLFYCSLHRELKTIPPLYSNMLLSSHVVIEILRYNLLQSFIYINRILKLMTKFFVFIFLHNFNISLQPGVFFCEI